MAAKSAATEKKQKEQVAKEMGKTLTDKMTGKEIINMDALEPEVRKMVAVKSKELQDAITEFGASGLKIGKVLKEIEVILKPRGVFTAYINNLPGFSTSTAYRWINAYDTAANRFPPAILNRILASGLSMIGDKSNPFGKYTDVVKKLPMPSGENVTTSQADNWLNQVQAEYRKGRGGKGAQIPDADTLQKEAYTAVMKRYQKVPDNTKQYWMKQLMGYIAFNLGWDRIDAPSKTPPSDWSATPTEKNGKEE